MTFTPTPHPRRFGRKPWLLVCAVLATLVSVGTWSWMAARRAGPAQARVRAGASTEAQSGQPVSGESLAAADVLPARAAREAPAAQDHGGTLELSGHVTDEQGQPLEGVRVLLLPQALTALERSVETTTGGEGRYRLATLPPGLYDVVFSTRRFLAHRVTGHTLTASGRLDAVLEAAPLVEGRVVDEQGRPIVGAHVRLAVPPDQGEWDTVDEYEEFGAVSRDQTAEDGRFVLDPPGPGPWVLSASHRDYLAAYQSEVAAPASGVELVLATGAVLEVEVRDEQGRPVANAECQLSVDGRWISEGEKRWTDEHGRAVYEVVAEGRYALSASTSPQGPLRVTSQKLELRGRERRQVRLQLPAGWELQGTVLDAKGRPLEGATVRAVPDLVLQPMHTWSRKREQWPVLNHSRRLMDEWYGKAGRAVSTGPDGRFVLKHLLPQAYRLNVSKPGYTLDVEATGSAVEVDGRETGLRVPEGGGPSIVVLAFQGFIRGRVVRQGGGPLTLFTLNAHAVESEDGRFAVPLDDDDAPVVLTFEAPGLAPTWRKVKPTPGRDVDLGDVVLAEGRPVRVRVVDAATGGPVGRASVSLVDERDGFSLSAGEWGLTEEDGVLRLESVERRALTVVVKEAEHLEARVRLEPGQEEVTVVLHAGATVQGWVRDAQGPVRLARAVLYSEAGEWKYELDVREGWYSRQGVAAGRYVVRVTAPDEVAASFPWQEVRVPEGGTVQLDLTAQTQGSVLEVRHPREVDRVRLIPGRHQPPSSLEELRAMVLRGHPYSVEWGQTLAVRFPALPAGPHTLVSWRIHRDRLELHLQEVEVAAGSSRVLELQPRWQPLPGRAIRSEAVWGMP
jgi:protocatechuate 3,4-dioxygenase beta subunit